MLKQVAEGVLVHESEFCQSNAVVVQGRAGVLLIDPGVLGDEMAAIANDLRELGQPVVAGFSTHPHWDHLLWHADLGDAPRYGTARCAATARDRLSDPGAKARIAAHLMPPDIAGRVPLDLLGLITGLPAGTAQIPWDGPEVRIIDHQAHAPGHAALLIEERGVLVAGDMLSDVLIPVLDVNGTADPVEDYLAALKLLESAAGGADVLVPGHGSVGGAGQVSARIDQDRAYVHAVRDARVPADPRVGPSAKPGWAWVSDVHERQLQQLAQRGERRDARLAIGMRHNAKMNDVSSHQTLRVLDGSYVLDHPADVSEVIQRADVLAVVFGPDGSTVMRRDDAGEDAWSALWNGDAAHDVQATGMLSAIVAPLAAGGVPVWVASAYDGDLVFVPASLDEASGVLQAAGHRVQR